LRHDAHAQWDIRELAQNIIEKAQEAAPLASVLISGKDTFPKNLYIRNSTQIHAD